MRRGTYSIVAQDHATGELGVAVQSHWFSVGSVVAWARPGVGAVATQSVAEVAHGPNTLDRLAQGEGFSCQANMMARAGVATAMAAGFTASEGDLAERLLLALEAGEAAGGDVRGRQSAVLLVVPVSGEPWRTRFDVRVEDAAEPLWELRRLVRLARAYEMAGEADERAALGEHGEASRLYLAASELAPEADELIFWAGLGVAAEDLAAGLVLVRPAIAKKPAWSALLERLSEELAPSAGAVRAALGHEPS
ncbi:MAG: DUF1028 domain-containing protein [Solirubrobacterales bacterium]|nr:DUF1028 domain-containing protein [Solirubrobacterales bacterium]